MLTYKRGIGWVEQPYTVWTKDYDKDKRVVCEERTPNRNEYGWWLERYNYKYSEEATAEWFLNDVTRHNPERCGWPAFTRNLVDWDKYDKSRRLFTIITYTLKDGEYVAL